MGLFCFSPGWQQAGVGGGEVVQRWDFWLVRQQLAAALGLDWQQPP